MVIAIITGCNQNYFKAPYVPSPKETLANQITKKVARELFNEKELHPCGSGGQAMHEIQMLALSFDYYKPIDMAQGRQLVIAAVEKFLAEINANDRIRPYLGNYPFKPKNIEIRIFLKNSDGSETEPNQLTVVSAIEGVIKYKVRNPDNTLFKIIYEEPYEEALRLAQSETSQIEDHLSCVSQDF